MGIFKNVGPETQEKKAPQKGHLGHTVLMILCCAIPLVLLAALPWIGKINPVAGNLVSTVAPFLCPALMLFMIPMMLGHGKEKSCHSDRESAQSEADRPQGSPEVQ